MWIDPLNAGAIDALLREVRGRGCIPFVGAGLSMPFKFPSWWSFLEGVAAEVGKEAEVRDALTGNDPELAAELLDDALYAAGHPDGISGRIRQAFGKSVDIRGATKGAAHYLPLLGKGSVITTNYDRVIEEIYLQHGRPLVPIWGAQTQVATEYLPYEAPLLLKLHGDAFHDADRVLTRAEYRSHYGAAGVDYSKSLPQLLDMLFRESAVLFLGCSLSADRTTLVLADVAARAETACFAVVARPNDATALRHREQELRNFGVTPIWYAHGDHGAIAPFLERLSAELDLDEPTEIALGPVLGTALSLDDDRESTRLERLRTRGPTLVNAEAILADGDADRQWQDYMDLRADLDQVDPRAAADIHARMAAIQVGLGERSAAAYAYFALYDAYRRLEDDHRAGRVLDELEHLLAAEGPGLDRIELNYTRTTFAYHRGDPRAAVRYARLALRDAREVAFEHAFAYARIWKMLGQALLALDRVRLGRTFLGKALWAYRRSGRTADAAHVLASLAGYYFDMDRPAKALRLARAGVRLVPATNLDDLATLYGNMGNALSELGRFREATEAHRLAWWYQRMAGSELASAAVHMGNVAWNLYSAMADAGAPVRTADGALERDLAWSIITFDQAIKIAEGEQASRDVAHLKVYRSVPLAKAGREGQALMDLRAALRVLRLEDRSMLATAYNNVGLVWEWLGEPPRARRWYARALATARTYPKGTGIQATVLGNLSRLGH